MPHESCAWHTPDIVCDDSFDNLEANSACYTLGYGGGTYDSAYDMTEWSETEIPFLMNNVGCESTSTNFSSCASNSTENCDHTENVLLTCFASGRGSLK